MLSGWLQNGVAQGRVGVVDVLGVWPLQLSIQPAWEAKKLQQRQASTVNSTS